MATIASLDPPSPRVTLRPTLEDGREIDALSDADRAELALGWHARAVYEVHSAHAFRRVTLALSELAVGDALIAFATSAAEDELCHGELCRAVAERFAGHALEAPSPPSIAHAEFGRVSPRLNAALTVIAHALVAEAFASSMLECSLRLARGRLARSVLVRMLSDELDHSPIGWTYLAGTNAAERERIEPFLHAVVASELKRARTSFGNTRGLATHGVPTHADVERALFGCVREAILPGFLSFGMPAHEIWTWLRRGASTRPEALRDVANFPNDDCLTEFRKPLDLR